MLIAITFCSQPKHERRNNEDRDSLFRWSEPESLPHLIQSETQVFLSHE